MKTQFAPAPREPMQLVLKQMASIETSEFLDRVLAKTPFMFFILNDKRQVVYSNHLLMEHLGYDEMTYMVGNRPGELFNCVHSDKEPGGCGTARNCRNCGAIQAVLESEKIQELVVKEAILNLKRDGKEVPANFRVSAKPFDWKGEAFFIVTLEDINAIKRKEQLERTFFHDIKNKAGIVNGFVRLLMKPESNGSNELYLKIAQRGITELLEDIDYQQALIHAENGDLEVREENISVQEIIEKTIEDYKEMADYSEITIQMKQKEKDVSLLSDPVLLKRILGNLMKNAIEASTRRDIISIWYEEYNGQVTFSIANPMVIPEEVQEQIFSRSFSTKGTGRGIGTYSIKLLTEDYLRGKVSFTSKEPEGTVFNVVFPK